MSREKLQYVNNILDRLKIAYGLKTDAALAGFLGLKPPAISNWRKRASIDYDLIFTKCDDINPGWILTGEGNVSHIDTGNANPLMRLDVRHPAWVACKQVDRIFEEGDKTKIDGLKGMLKALDPGEKKPSMDAVQDEESGAKSDCA